MNNLLHLPKLKSVGIRGFEDAELESLIPIPISDTRALLFKLVVWKLQPDQSDRMGWRISRYLQRQIDSSYTSLILAVAKRHPLLTPSLHWRRYAKGDCMSYHNNLTQGLSN